MTDRENTDEGADTEQWAFTLDDIEQREADQRRAERLEAERSRPIESGNPTLEGSVFVLLGAAVTIFVLSRFFLG